MGVRPAPVSARRLAMRWAKPDLKSMNDIKEAWQKTAAMELEALDGSATDRSGGAKSERGQAGRA